MRRRGKDMSTAGAFLVLLPGLAGALGSGISSEPVPIAPPALTCAIYALAHEFALAIQPNMSDAQSSAVWDALRLDAACANTTKATKRARGGARSGHAPGCTHECSGWTPSAPRASPLQSRGRPTWASLAASGPSGGTCRPWSA